MCTTDGLAANRAADSYARLWALMDTALTEAINSGVSTAPEYGIRRREAARNRAYAARRDLEAALAEVLGLDENQVRQVESMARLARTAI